jgi:restriction system protein
MAKRKQSGIDVVASMPWPVGIVLGLIAYIAICHGISWYLGSINNPYTSGLGKLAATGIYAPLGWILLVGCWSAAGLPHSPPSLAGEAVDTYSTSKPASTACVK